MRLTVEDANLGPGLYADFYPAGPAHEPRPLLVYFCGALSERRYEERRNSEPSIVVETFREATAVDSEWDLLVVPPPPSLTDRGPALRRIMTGLVAAFIKASTRPDPSGLGAVGMSYGAMLGCAFALEERRCKRLATLAGVGMAELVEPAPLDDLEGKRFKCFVNKSDPLSEHSKRFADLMGRHGWEVEVVRREGEHSFKDFVANGSASSAFRFATAAPIDVWGPVRCGSVEGLKLPELTEFERGFLRSIVAMELESSNRIDPPKFDPARRQLEFERATRHLVQCGADPVPVLIKVAVYLETLAVIEAAKPGTRGVKPPETSQWLRETIAAASFKRYLSTLKAFVDQLQSGGQITPGVWDAFFMNIVEVRRHAIEFHKAREGGERHPFSLRDRAALLAANDLRTMMRVSPLKDEDPRAASEMKNLLQRLQRTSPRAFLMDFPEGQWGLAGWFVPIEPDDESDS